MQMFSSESKITEDVIWQILNVIEEEEKNHTFYLVVLLRSPKVTLQKKK